MRNYNALTEEQIVNCQMAFDFLISGMDGNINFDKSKFAGFKIELDISEAKKDGSGTRFNENQNKIYLGADVYPGAESDANSKMSYLACLAHELAHAERYYLGFTRPVHEEYTDIDEAETSLHASFNPPLLLTDRKYLIEDAKQRLNNWSIRK